MPTPSTNLAESILAQLGQDFTIPAVDLSTAEYAFPDTVGNAFYEETTPIEISDLTTGAVGGTGAFDQIMSSHKAHLKEQYDKGRITGDQYAKAYVELTTAAMSAGVQMALGRDSNYWQAKLVQMQGRRAEIEAVTAKVQHEVVKAQLAAARRQAELVNAQYVLTLMQISRESENFDLTTAQIALAQSQRLAVDKEVEVNDYKLDNLMPQELAQLTQQVQILFAQENLVQEQAEAQRAQTVDIRSDGITPVTGNMGKQKELYDQQITSYRRDAEQKVGKMFLDAWITQKTLDEGLTPPAQLTNTEVNEVLAAVRLSHGLGS